MRCPECRGNAFEVGVYDVGDMYDGAPVLIRNAAGAKCSQCGHLLLPATVAKALGKMLALGYSHATVPAKVYDLAELDVGTVISYLAVGQYTPGINTLGTFHACTPEVPPIVESNTEQVA